MPRNGFGEDAVENGNGAVPPLPSFFIIGPPRTGTSWLHEVLSKCACLSHPTKETRFFDKHYDRGLEWYGSHYRKVTEGRLIGEVAPTYFASPEARERIARLVPQAKIVCTFRNPVDRIFSLYRLKRAYGFIPWNFEEALERDPELMESSRYAAHLKEWQKTFGQSQVMATTHDDMQADPQAYLDRLVDFLGLPRVRLVPAHSRRVLTSEDMTVPRNYYLTRGAILLAEWSRAQRLDTIVAAAKKWGALKLFVGGGPPFPELPVVQRAKLRALFRPDVDELEGMLNRDLSAWK
jgi:hypothetical protein